MNIELWKSQGSRVRCVKTDHRHLVVGAEYTVAFCATPNHVCVDGIPINYLRDRFKPVVRVKMGRGRTFSLFEVLAKRQADYDFFRGQQQGRSEHDAGS